MGDYVSTKIVARLETRFLWNQLVAIGNQLKNHRDYDGANAVTDMLFCMYSADRAGRVNTSLVWEVEPNMEAADDDAAYFDLIGVQASDGGYLCIPLPLLDPKRVLELIRAGVRMVPRGKHGGRPQTDDAESVARLREKANDVAGGDIFAREPWILLAPQRKEENAGTEVPA